MDVLQNQIIDIGLNVVGYLVAGALGMLLYSTIQHHRAAMSITQTQPPTSKLPGKAHARNGNGLEFVDLHYQENPNYSAQGDSRGMRAVSGKHRDRVEIIRLAREMIKTGTSQEMIKRTLPVSDGELALLQRGNEN